MGEDTKGKDQLLLGPKQADGSHPYIRHLPDHRIERGVIHPQVPSGQDVAGPANADIVHLSPTEGSDHVYDVETIYTRPRGPANVGKGPAKVSNQAFRSGWDRIFNAPGGSA